MELFKSMTGIQMVHVPYKGSAGVLADLIGGQIVVTMDNMPPYIPRSKPEKFARLPSARRIVHRRCRTCRP